MARRLGGEIRRSRELLQNPYAYLDGEGRYDAIPSDRKRGVHDDRRVLENQYAYLDENGGYSEWPDYEQQSPSCLHAIDADQLLGKRARGQGFSAREIEAIARKLQIEMWRRRTSIWPQREQMQPREILDPVVALRSIGYAVEIEESLGRYSESNEFFEVAGIIDRSKAHVNISRRFSLEIRNFTAAHELGHAILHAGSELHRDRALDGALGGGPRDTTEVEADTFAAYFLLPEKQVRAAFEEMFLTQRFTLSDDTAFALTARGLDAMQNRCRTLRDLTRILASAEYYNGEHFHSLAKQFGVSTEAMAIRLEELDLAEE